MAISPKFRDVAFTLTVGPLFGGWLFCILNVLKHFFCIFSKSRKREEGDETAGFNADKGDGIQKVLKSGRTIFWMLPYIKNGMGKQHRTTQSTSFSGALQM